MTLNLARAYAPSCLGYVLNATCILITSWIVSVNLMGIIRSEGDTESIFVLFCTQLTLT